MSNSSIYEEDLSQEEVDSEMPPVDDSNDYVARNKELDVFEDEDEIEYYDQEEDLDDINSEEERELFPQDNIDEIEEEASPTREGEALLPEDGDLDTIPEEEEYQENSSQRIRYIRENNPPEEEEYIEGENNPPGEEEDILPPEEEEYIEGENNPPNEDYQEYLNKYFPEEEYSEDDEIILPPITEEYMPPIERGLSRMYKKRNV
jgi:hypothetical protein